jgi:uncharacterized Zn-finger protein
MCTHGETIKRHRRHKNQTMVRVLIGTGPKKGIGGSANAKTSYQCKTCNKTFKSQKELQAHNKKVHGNKNYGVFIHEK